MWSGSASRGNEGSCGSRNVHDHRAAGVIVSFKTRVFGGSGCIVSFCGVAIVCCNLPLEEVFDNPNRRHRVENQTRYCAEQYRRPHLTFLRNLEDGTIAEAK